MQLRTSPAMLLISCVVLHATTTAAFLLTRDVSGPIDVSLLKPQGIRFAVPDSAGITLVSYHYNINSPLPGVAAGQYAVDITSKTGNEWVYENPSAPVHPGDTVHYWYNIIQNGLGHVIQDQTWVAALPTSTPKPTTPKPTTHAQTQQPAGTVAAGTQAPVNNMNPTSNSLEPTTQGSSNVVTNSNVQSQTGTGSQVASSSSGTCGCTGSSIRPPGSELSCSSFPCMIFEDNFDFLNLDVWEHEITASGGGNWEFEYYTNNRTNSYVRDGKLFIKPTFTLETLNDGPDALQKGALDIWGSVPGDVCTGNNFWGCRRDGTPEHIINPIQSARLRSSRGFNFKYGKVEIRAKMPKGDWIWPAIWLLPLRNAYGRWPASGEIDMVETRGNLNIHDDQGHSQGIDNAGSTLHFGSDFWHNKFLKAHGEKMSSSGTYADDFHIYQLIWDEDHISISIDGTEVMNATPQTNMWEFGGLDKDGVENPWAAGSKMAPFDQEFFFILNVAVGGTGGFFPDNWQYSPGKPWHDKSEFSARDFWNARGQWYPTWNPDQNNGEDAAMQVDYIRVWKLKP